MQFPSYIPSIKGILRAAWASITGFFSWFRGLWGESIKESGQNNSDPREEGDVNLSSPQKRQAFLETLKTRLEDTDDWKIREAALPDLVRLFRASSDEYGTEIETEIRLCFRARLLDKESLVRSAAAKVFAQLCKDYPRLRGCFTLWLSGDPEKEALRVKKAAMNAFVQVFNSCPDSLRQEWRQNLIKLLRPRFKDDDLSIKGSALEIFVQVFSDASPEEREALLFAFWACLSDPPVEEAAAQAFANVFQFIPPKNRVNWLSDFLNLPVKQGSDHRAEKLTAQRFVLILHAACPKGVLVASAAERSEIVNTFITLCNNSPNVIRKIALQEEAVFCEVFIIASSEKRPVLLEALKLMFSDDIREAAVQVFVPVFIASPEAERPKLLEALKSVLLDSDFEFLKKTAEEASINQASPRKAFR